MSIEKKDTEMHPKYQVQRLDNMYITYGNASVDRQKKLNNLK